MAEKRAQKEREKLREREAEHLDEQRMIRDQARVKQDRERTQSPMISPSKMVSTTMKTEPMESGPHKVLTQKEKNLRHAR